MQKEAFSPFPILSTSRLTLRQLSKEDAPALSALRSNEHVNRYIDRKKQTTLAQANAFIHNINLGIRACKWLYWAICLKEKPTLIGTICLWNFSANNTIAEVGYELDPRYQGRGIMSEALACVISHSFRTLKLQALEAFTHKDNCSSLQLLLKHHFQLESNRKDDENENNSIFILMSSNTETSRAKS